VAHSDGLRSAEGTLRCPISATHDKYDEAHYFLERMMREYHRPHPFRWNLNAFLQALRAVDYMIRSELGDRDDFQAWYVERIQDAAGDLRRIIDARNTVVHEGMLQRQSVFESGLFRGRRFKLLCPVEVPWYMPSEVILERTKVAFTGFLIDEDHSAIGEQLGVRRRWKVEELGDEEVLTVCDRAWLQAAEIVIAAHIFAEPRFEDRRAGEEMRAPWHDVNKVNVLLESDLDSTLLQKWGWPDDVLELVGENPLSRR